LQIIAANVIFYHPFSFDTVKTGLRIRQKGVNIKGCLSIFPEVLRLAGVAQSAERLICNQQVGGSIPLASSKLVQEGYLTAPLLPFLAARGDTQAAKGGRL
jgi:hypothetical protein